MSYVKTLQKAIQDSLEEEIKEARLVILGNSLRDLVQHQERTAALREIQKRYCDQLDYATDMPSVVFSSDHPAHDSRCTKTYCVENDAKL